MTKAAFIEVMMKEFEMIKIFRPNELNLDKKEDRAFSTVDKFQTKLTVNPNKLNDTGYLQSLQESADKKSKANEKLEKKDLGDYIEQEEEGTDMFLFLKYVNPSLFE